MFKIRLKFSNVQASNSCKLKVNCHAKPVQCKSKFLKLLTVWSNFPQMRSLVNLIYSMLRCNKKINEIQEALTNTDVKKL